MKTAKTQIELWHAIARENLSGEHYVESLLHEGVACGVLTSEDADTARLRVLELLAHRCALYHSGSSSVRAETAAHILESTLFTLGLACKGFPSADAAALALKTASLAELFTRGRAATRSELRRTRQLWLMVLHSKTQTENAAYNATFSEAGIGDFFRGYEMEFSAHELPGSIDYPLFCPVSDLAGVEFIRLFLANALCENQFCACFPAEAVRHVMHAYEKRCDELLLNLFGRVLQQALGCVLAGRDPYELVLSATDITTICARIDAANPLGVLGPAADALLDVFPCRGAVEAYVRASLPGVAAEVQYAFRRGAPEKAYSVSK